MAWVDYQRILDGSSVSGKLGESLQVAERWQIRVDSPATSKADIIAGVTATAGITWGTPHFEFPALQAMEFDLAPEGKDGMRWILTVRYYVPPAGKRLTENGIPEDVWEQTGGSTTIPAFTDSSGDTITNSAGDPLEGLEKEREEIGWSLTKYYEDDATLEADISAYAGRVNSDTWASYGPKRWKCYYKGAKRQEVSKLDGDDDAGTLEFIESRWEFRLEVDTWKAMPWDIGFMELNGSGEKIAITTDDGKVVKQPVALNSDGSAKTPGEPPDVINAGEGVDLYLTADWSTAFGEPALLAGS